MVVEGTSLSRFQAAVMAALPEMSDDLMDGWCDNPQALQRTLTKLLCPPTETVRASGARKVLGECTALTTPERTEAFNPHQFYQTRQGLYVWDGLKNFLLPVAKQVESLPLKEIAWQNLLKDANDKQIRAELSDSHVFEDASHFLTMLAGMIERQPKGKQGDLLASGYANIFYVRGVSGRVFALYVYWYADNRKWNVDVCRLDDYHWNAGYRVFSRNCPSVS